MEVKRVCSVYWSATGNSRKTAEIIAGELAEKMGCPLDTIDFTCPKDRESTLTFAEGDLVVFVTPTYAGKVPNKILPFVKEKIFGNGALAVPVVTFGNRSYDNALAELSALMENDGFHTVAGGVFVGRHSFTDKLAFGRPNEDDKKLMKHFAQQVADKIKALDKIPAPIKVPGDSDAPYYSPKGADGQPVKFLKAKPKTDLAKCSNCGVCARQCPMGAIDLENVAEVPGTCIKCHRCIRICTKGAKYFDDAALLSHLAMVEQNFGEPKVNEIFL